MEARALTAPPLLTATLEIAGLVFRVRCVHAKPVWWAGEAHPAFACDRPPEFDVLFTYDEAYWDRGLPWIAEDTVADVPEATRRGRAATIGAAFYRIEVDLDARRAEVGLAAGFRADAPMRALCALVLPERGALLLRATRLLAGDGCVLLVGPASGRTAAPAGAFDGWVAVLERDGRWIACTTPLQDGEAIGETPVERRLDAIRFVDADGAAAPATLSAAETARRVLPHLCVVEQEPATVARLLELAGRLAQACGARA